MLFLFLLFLFLFLVLFPFLSLLVTLHVLLQAFLPLELLATLLHLADKDLLEVTVYLPDMPIKGHVMNSGEVTLSTLMGFAGGANF